MANTWFVCIDPVDKGKPASFLDLVDFRIQVQPSDPNYKTLQSGGVIDWTGQPLVKWKGPFATEAEAKAAQNPKQQSPNPASDLATAAKNASGGPLAGLAAIGDFFQRLTQANTWVRIGEGILGLILLAVGVARITHAVPVATKVAKAVGTKGLA